MAGNIVVNADSASLNTAGIGGIDSKAWSSAPNCSQYNLHPSYPPAPRHCYQLYVWRKSLTSQRSSQIAGIIKPLLQEGAVLNCFIAAGLLAILQFDDDLMMAAVMPYYVF